MGQRLTQKGHEEWRQQLAKEREEHQRRARQHTIASHLGALLQAKTASLKVAAASNTPSRITLSPTLWMGTTADACALAHHLGAMVAYYISVQDGSKRINQACDYTHVKTVLAHHMAQV